MFIFFVSHYSTPTICNCDIISWVSMVPPYKLWYKVTLYHNYGTLYHSYGTLYHSYVFTFVWKCSKSPKTSIQTLITSEVVSTAAATAQPQLSLSRCLQNSIVVVVVAQNNVKQKNKITYSTVIKCLYFISMTSRNIISLAPSSLEK